MCDGNIEQDMSPGSNSTKRVGRILTLLIIIIIKYLSSHFAIINKKWINITKLTINASTLSK